MYGVHSERAAAATQIGRTLRVWRKAEAQEVSDPEEPAEKEADAVAEKVSQDTGDAAPEVSAAAPKVGIKVFRAPAGGPGNVQQAQAYVDRVFTSCESTLQQAASLVMVGKNLAQMNEEQQNQLLGDLVRALGGAVRLVSTEIEKVRQGTAPLLRGIPAGHIELMATGLENAVQDREEFIFKRESDKLTKIRDRSTVGTLQSRGVIRKR
jgi:hypothetical protein